VPTVSIILRTKDRPVLLERALRDIAHQSFTDWRLIIVNDGGTPETVESVVASGPEAVRQKHDLVHVDHSRGMEAASNLALEKTEGRYVAVHDDDDTWHPDFLARTVEVLEGDDDLGGVAVRTHIIWEKFDESGALVETGREPFLPKQTGLFLSDLLVHNRWVPISFLFRRSLVAMHGSFRDDLPVVGDWDYHLRLMAAGVRIAFLADEPLAYWHQRPGLGGVDGNSVIASRDLHRHFDLALRDEHIRAYVKERGLGLPLLIAESSSRVLRDVMPLLESQRQRLDEQRQLLEEILREVRVNPLRRIQRGVATRLGFGRR
jgi:glycosyltransferase involved in cell wall biosynthesis